MKIIGIGGDIAFLGNSEFSIKDQEQEEKIQRKKRVGMIAAGSGISPMFQLIQTVADLGNSDSTSLSLIYSNRTPVSLISEPDIDFVVRHHSRRRLDWVWESRKAVLFPPSSESWWELDAWTRASKWGDDKVSDARTILKGRRRRLCDHSMRTT